MILLLFINKIRYHIEHLSKIFNILQAVKVMMWWAIVW